jgi:phospholipid/cholesterol/gamma-HCH transport system substrate-binding protein
MRRAAAVALLLAAVAAVVIVIATSGDEGGYKVRAIFDNAGFVIPGEDVKVAGVKVGTVDEIDVTDDFKAAIVLDIEDPGYQDFREDAECIVRPQSLIGERFVECEPTQARPPGEEAPPELRTIEDGPGEGQRLLPVERTAKAVDLDLVNNIMREPQRERLSIILADLGVGLAGRGSDLNEVIRRANPALKEIDEVLAILASQNRVLADLARDSDAALAPLARERERVGSAIRNVSDVAGATAERRADLQENLRRLPTFLRELRPTMRRLGTLSDEMTPVLTDLGAVAPDVNRMVMQLGPLASAGTVSLESLGEAAETGTPAVIAARPVIADIRRLAAALRPVGSTLAALLESLDRTEGIERLMDYIFYQAVAINGFDSAGHYLRAGLIVNACSTYAVERGFGCSANFAGGASAAGASAAAAGPRDPSLVRTQAALARALGIEAPKQARPDGARKKRRDRPARERRAPRPPDRRGEGGRLTPQYAPRLAPSPPANPTPTPTPPAGAPAPTPTPTPAPAPKRKRQRDDGSAAEDVLDYLFGGDK